MAYEHAADQPISLRNRQPQDAQNTDSGDDLQANFIPNTNQTIPFSTIKFRFHCNRAEFPLF